MQTSEIKNAVLYNCTYTAGTPGTRLDPFHVVKLTTATNTIDLCAGGSGAPDKPYGIVLDKTDYDLLDSAAILATTYTSGSYTDGDTAVVVCLGQCLAIVGTGGVTAGNFVMADASGHVVDYVPGGYIIGMAIETATAGNLARIQVEPMATADAVTAEKQVASANGAITISNGLVVITKAGVCALTLADPTTDNNYDRIKVFSNTAYAHTVTADWNGAGSAAYTFPAEAGSSIEFIAYGGKWMLPTTIKCAAFVGALSGNATTATTATTANSLAAASVFVSTEKTANGSAQNVPHGLVTSPTLAFAFISQPTGNAGDTIAWTKDATNVAVTATNTVKYFVVAIK